METYPEWLKRLVPRPDVWHERVDPALAGDGTLPKANSQAKSGFFLDRLDRRDRPEAGCVGSRHSVTGHREAYCARWRRKSALRVRTSISIMTRFRLGTGLCPAPVLRSNSAHVQPVTRARSGTSGAMQLCICPTSKNRQTLNQRLFAPKGAYPNYSIQIRAWLENSTPRKQQFLPPTSTTRTLSPNPF